MPLGNFSPLHLRRRLRFRFQMALMFFAALEYPIAQ
jgi:hypothetical protein